MLAFASKKGELERAELQLGKKRKTLESQERAGTLRRKRRTGTEATAVAAPTVRSTDGHAV
jgi:hypothetical protein